MRPVNHRAFPLPGELARARLGAPVLPHDRPVQRLAGSALPHAHRFALIRDAECHRHNLRLIDRLARGFQDDPEDLVGVVLHLTGVREILGDLTVPAPKHSAIGGDDQRRRAGGARINRQDGAHGSAPNGGCSTPRSVM